MSHRRPHEREPSRALLGLALAAAGVAGYLLGSRRQGETPRTPSESGPPVFDPTTIRRAPPVKLEAHSLHDFVAWVAGTPVSDAQAIRDAVAEARADDEAARALVASLFDLPVRDLGYHQLLLSVIGEMRRPEFAEPLIRFIELPPDRIVPEGCGDPTCGACTSYLDAAALLKARAAEMLAHLRTSEALEAVIGFAAHHDSRVVRLAAVDAYEFNHEDSPEALDRLRAAVRRDEAKFVGLPRRTREGDPAEFAARVAAFYEQYPEELPPAHPPAAGARVHKRAPAPRRAR